MTVQSKANKAFTKNENYREKRPNTVNTTNTKTEQLHASSSFRFLLSVDKQKENFDQGFRRQFSLTKPGDDTIKLRGEKIAEFHRFQ